MILFNPTKRAQLAHITNLISMARLDGTITANEEEYIMLVAKEFGLTQSEIDQCYKNSDRLIIEVPKTDEDKVEYLKNVVSMMLSDGGIDQQKRNLAERICEKFGYKGKETVDLLYNDLVKEAQEFESDNKDEQTEMSEEEFRVMVQNRIAEGAKCLLNNDMSGAFEQLLYASMADETARRLFMRIPRAVYPMFMLTDAQVDEMKELTAKGYAVAKYALGRYHQLVQPDDDSLEQARDLFISAAEGGLAEALFGVALLYRDGNYEEADRDKYLSLRQEAIEKGSIKAFYMYAKDIIYGNNDYEADPKTVINFVNDLVKGATGKESEDIFGYEPEYFDLLGRAYEELGNIEKAEEAYIQAVSLGNFESLANLINMMCYDNEGNLVEEAMFNKYIEIGIQHNDAFCFTLLGNVNEEDYNALNPREKAKKTTEIKANLEKAYQLGDTFAPLLLGNNYYYGNLGFEENDEEAWKWYNLGALYGSSECYGMLVTMIDEGHCPRKTDDKFRAFCALSAYRHGDDSYLDDVIEAYDNGFLNGYKNEIEKYYLPIYESQNPSDDDGRFDPWV